MSRSHASISSTGKRFVLVELIQPSIQSRLGTGRPIEMSAWHLRVWWAGTSSASRAVWPNVAVRRRAMWKRPVRDKMSVHRNYAEKGLLGFWKACGIATVKVHWLSRTSQRINKTDSYSSARKVVVANGGWPPSLHHWSQGSAWNAPQLTRSVAVRSSNAIKQCHNKCHESKTCRGERSKVKVTGSI